MLELRHKLGPVNWQLAPTHSFDPDDLDGFLTLLPTRIGGQQIRHAIEVRHDSFRHDAFVELARAHDVAIVMAGDSRYPQIPDLTAKFVYVRIMGTTDAHPLGYADDALDLWTERARLWATGKLPKGLEAIGKPAAHDIARDVFLYVISGFKARNPAAGIAMIERLRRDGA